MPEIYTASAIHNAFCEANGLDPQEQPALLTRFRYLAKRGLLLNGSVADDRGTYAFSKLEVYRAALYADLAGLAMDIRALAPIADAAARRHPDGLRIPPSMKMSGGFRSRGGLWDSVNGVAQGETWTLLIELKRSGTSSAGGLSAEFVCEDVADRDYGFDQVDAILGREKVRTRASVDLTALFLPLTKIVGVPE